MDIIKNDLLKVISDFFDVKSKEIEALLKDKIKVVEEKIELLNVRLDLLEISNDTPRADSKAVEIGFNKLSESIKKGFEEMMIALATRDKPSLIEKPTNVYQHTQLIGNSTPGPIDRGKDRARLRSFSFKHRARLRVSMFKHKTPLPIFSSFSPIRQENTIDLMPPMRLNYHYEDLMNLLFQVKGDVIGLQKDWRDITENLKKRRERGSVTA